MAWLANNLDRVPADRFPVGMVVAAGAVVALAVVLYVAGAGQAKKRREAALAALREFAGELELGFTAQPAYDVHELYEPLSFHPFGRGRSRRSSNLLFGQRAGIVWEAFDYRYTTGPPLNPTTHRYGIVAAKVPLEFPRTRVRPEGLDDKLRRLLGYEDINFESAEFSRRYHVYCTDRRRAYDLVHPQLMEFLLAADPPRDWQLAGPIVLLATPSTGPQDPPMIRTSMRLIERFLACVPQYVREDLDE